MTENKTQRTAITGEKSCGFKIGWKNTTDLKRHLKAHNLIMRSWPQRIG